MILHRRPAHRAHPPTTPLRRVDGRLPVPALLLAGGGAGLSVVVLLVAVAVSAVSAVVATLVAVVVAVVAVVAG